MALLTTKTTQELFDRVSDIDFQLADFFISWSETQRLYQERAELIEELNKRGYYEP